MKNACFAAVVLSVLTGSTAAATPGDFFAQLPNIEANWGLSPLKPELRHRFEGASVDSSHQKLMLRVWYEDSSVTKNAPAGAPIFCRLAHSLLFGRTQLRSSSERLPIAQAFSSSKELSSVEMVFYAVVFRNRPNAANAPGKLAGLKNLRVLWAREEQIVPYLSLTVSRAEWQNIGAALKHQKNVSFETFRDTLCEGILRLTPNLKANFSALTQDSENERIDLTNGTE